MRSVFFFFFNFLNSIPIKPTIGNKSKYTKNLLTEYIIFAYNTVYNGQFS